MFVLYSGLTDFQHHILCMCIEKYILRMPYITRLGCITMEMSACVLHVPVLNYFTQRKTEQIYSCFKKTEC